MVIWTLLWRDLRSRLRDRSALVLAVLAPAALITVLSLLVAGPSVEGVPVGYAGPADAPVSSILEQGSLAALESDGTITLTRYADADAVRAAVDDDVVDGGLAVSDDGRRVTVYTNADAVVASAILQSVARSAGLTVDAVGQAAAAERALGRTDRSPQQIAGAVMAEPSATTLTDADESVGGIDAKTQVAAGMATFFLFFGVQFGVLGLLEERRRGTLPRLLAAPVPPWQVLASKLLVSMAIGLASMTTLVLFSSLLLGAEWGDPVGVAVLVVSGVLAAVATVTLVVGVAKSPDQAGAAQAMLALVLGILGGAFFSMARAGGVAAVATRLTPHYWFSEGLVRLSGGRDWTSALEPAAAMLLFAVVVGLPGLLLARRTVRA